jgi:hypothetical protein
MRLPLGYELEDFIENLNGRVFFWPGTSQGPIPSGLRHFERYRLERPVILRVHYNSLIAENNRISPEYCPYNSGSPGCSQGKKIPRGPNTFLSEADFGRTASQVVEVTFAAEVALPGNTEFGNSPTGAFRQLFSIK